ncbi:MAG TPA: hypothetical protein VFZ25_19445, partial [Chloroflexota bacterium]|nr:hypothetical protein [Chloroflexota bacterium]
MAVATLDERLGDAVLATVAYADLFDFPLEPAEIWRDLIGVEADWELTRAATERLVASGALASDPPYLV